MNGKYRQIMAGLTLCIFVAAFSAACTFPADGAAPRDAEQFVQIEPMAGVANEATTEIKQAAEATRRFFAESAGLRMQKPVTIVLTKDRNSFVSEVMNRFNIGELEAKRVANGVEALSGEKVIVLNVGGVATARQKTFLLAHELTHYYLRQIAANPANGVKWMPEGMAEAVGAQVVDRQGYWKLYQYRANWQQGLETAIKKPGLGELKTADGWSKSISQYGPSITYVTAGLAVLMLIDQFGQDKVLDYFAGLGRGDDPETSFQRAFGMSLAEFADYYARSVRKVS